MAHARQTPRQLRNFLQQAPRGQQSYGPLMPDAYPSPEGVVSEAEFWQGRDPDSVVRESEYFRTPRGQVQAQKLMDPASIVRESEMGGWTWENLARALSPEALQELAVLLNKMGDPDSVVRESRMGPVSDPDSLVRESEYVQRNRMADPNSVVRESEYRRSIDGVNDRMADPNSIVRESEYRRGRRGR